MYSDVFGHTELNLCRMFIIRQLVSTSSIGHHQAIVQEHQRLQKPNTMK
jgi:hypothetical protein